MMLISRAKVNSDSKGMRTQVRNQGSVCQFTVCRIMMKTVRLTQCLRIVVEELFRAVNSRK